MYKYVVYEVGNRGRIGVLDADFLEAIAANVSKAAKKHPSICLMLIPDFGYADV